ncbi:MAG: hypothetical protein ACTSRK_06025 [Promethearchaeota archaeon]
MSDGRTNTTFKEKRRNVVRYYRDNVYWAPNGDILEWNNHNRDKIMQKMMGEFQEESEFEIERILDEYHKNLNG